MTVGEPPKRVCNRIICACDGSCFHVRRGFTPIDFSNAGCISPGTEVYVQDTLWVSNEGIKNIEFSKVQNPKSWSIND